MKISEAWLKEMVAVPADAMTLAARFTMAGLEVARVYPAVPVYDAVRIGRVLAVEPHPHADNLKVCRVAVGEAVLQIVCGAPNVRIGMRAPVALVGGTLPDGTVIREAELRGVESAGMLCSARELDLSDDHTGLFELDADAKVGEPFADYLGGDDTIIEIEITPNRGDCLSMLGISREAGALFEREVRVPQIPAISSPITEVLPVVVEEPGACPIFTGRVVRGINPRARTPLWLRERLRRAGIRPLSPVVDITQYVMLELGQPLHGYTLNAIQGGIVVRYAQHGERVTLLNGSDVSLESNMLVIADHTRVLGLAGIMGGADTAVQSDTADIFLECAYFDPAAINGRARTFGLTTDAGYRFERGVDPSGQVKALERATQLLLEFAGGVAGPLSDVRSTAHKPGRADISLRRERLDSLLGIHVPDASVERILNNLGMSPVGTAQGWNLRAPAHRFDIEIEEDLVEEVGRVYGYDHIPAIQYPSTACLRVAPPTRVPMRRLLEVLVQRGYQEVITYSFVDAQRQTTLMGEPGIALANPVSEDMAAMRVSLLPGLIDALRYNLNRQQTRVRIFESGLRFILQDDEIKQENMIAGLVSGALYPEQWDLSRRSADFYDLKGDVEALLMLGGRQEMVEEIPARHAALHPGQSARVRIAGQDAGWLGLLHPTVIKRLDLSQHALVFELALKPVLEQRVLQLHSISRFPVIRRDLAVVVPEEVTGAELLACARAVAPPIVRALHIFDVYRGAGIDSGRKSVALGLILQDYSRTLTEEEVARAMVGVRAGLHEKLGAAIRD